MNTLSIFPKPSPLKEKSLVFDLKSRLDWGKPGLTILDVSDRDLFRRCRIVGAVSMPKTELLDLALKSIRFDRDLYVYGDTDTETAEAADVLRAAGYEYVSELRGGVAAWKAVGFPVELMY
ncbi:MAG: rhodanese-like domain-containing protein [Geitlerinemataceae cyanobacterium]